MPMNPKRTIRRLSLLLVALPVVASAQTKSPAPSGPPLQIEQGRNLYRVKGCYQCHGLVGQGGMGVGPPLAPGRLPPEVFKAYVRSPGGSMPPYSPKLLSDPELDLIIGFLRGLPQARSAADIQILRPYATSAGAVSGGQLERSQRRGR